MAARAPATRPGRAKTIHCRCEGGRGRKRKRAGEHDRHSHTEVLANQAARSIFSVDNGAAIPAALTEKCKYERIAAPSRSQTFRALAKLLPYPMGLLRSDPQLVAVMLRARFGIRLTSKFGNCFRNSN